MYWINRPLSNYASVPTNNNLKSTLRARKYSKCMKTWHEASASGYCSRELKRTSKVVYCTWCNLLFCYRGVLFYIVSYLHPCLIMDIGYVTDSFVSYSYLTSGLAPAAEDDAKVEA